MTFYIYSIAWLVLHEGKDFYCWLVFSQRTMPTSLHLAKNCMKLFKILISSDVKFKINIKSWVSFLINFIYLVHIYSSQSIDMPKCLLYWNTILFLLSVLEANSGPIIYKLSIYDFFKYTLALCKYWSGVKAMRNIHGNIPQTLWTTS